MSLFYGYESKHESDVTGKLSTTGGDMTGDINMGSHHVITSVDPTENAHLARKKYVDDKVATIRGGTSAFLSKTGGTMTGNIRMGNNRITTTVNPTNVKDLTRKKYVDDQDARRLSITGGTMSGNIIMGNNKITTTADPKGDKDLSRKKYVDDKVITKLSLTGGTMSGDLNMGTNKVISSSDPTDDTHLARKKYVDNQDNSKLSLTGGTMSGDLNMGTNKVTSSATPSNNNDLTTKSYVDGNFINIKNGTFYGNRIDELKGNRFTKDFQIFTERDPNDASSLTRKKYVNDEDNKKLSLTGGTMTGNINIGTNKVISTSNPTDATHLTRKKYVDDELNKKVNKSGGTMTGDLSIGNNKIITTSDPTNDTHLSRKKYVDDQDDTKLSLTGGNMTGDINMGNHKIIKNSDPTENTHLTWKKYVDKLVNDKTETVRTALKNTAYQLNLIQSYILNSDLNFYGEIYDLTSYLKYDGTDNRIEVWYNQSKISDENFTETNKSKQLI